MRQAQCFNWIGAAVLGLGCVGAAQAAAWVDVGDRAQRADVELLAAHGQIAALVSSWPLPDGQLAALAGRDLSAQPADVRAAAARLIAARLQGQPRGLSPALDWRATNEPAVVRDFGTLARQPADISAGFDWTGSTVSLDLRAGLQSHYDGSEARFALDGTALDVLFGNLQVYAGWVDQWWGPGQVSSLTLSNNARPLPKIGLMRNDPHAFESRWLSWLGPWQIDTWVGVLDGPRTDRNTILAALRGSFNPLPGLEIGLSRVTELCGDNHPCDPLTAEFRVTNGPNSTNKVNEQAGFDMRWAKPIGAVVLTPYVQFMNEDTGPFTHGYTSHLYGLQLAGPWGEGGARWQLGVESTDSVATLNIFSYGKYATGTAYNNSGYTDGFRYRDRTLGFSLDSESRLLSLTGGLTDARGWTWRAALHGAGVSTTELAVEQGPGLYNSLVTQPQHLLIGELGLQVPWRALRFDMGLRAQNHALEPVQSDRFAVEAGVEYRY